MAFSQTSFCKKQKEVFLFTGGGTGMDMNHSAEAVLEREDENLDKLIDEKIKELSSIL